MPRVKLKVNRWLCQALNLEPIHSEEVSIVALEGESLPGMVCRLAGEDGLFWKTIFDEKTQGVASNVLVILNGRVVNPYDRAETVLKEGDELTFLPMFDGG